MQIDVPVPSWIKGPPNGAKDGRWSWKIYHGSEPGSLGLTGRLLAPPSEVRNCNASKSELDRRRCQAANLVVSCLFRLSLETR
jgi:hypothetical protein